MPSLGIAEILVIAVVALVFLGPDKLPKAAKQLGNALRELRRHSENVKAELRDVVDIDGVAEMHRDFKQAVDFRSVLTDATVGGTAGSRTRPQSGKPDGDAADSIVDAATLDSDTGVTRRLAMPDRSSDSVPTERD